MVVFGGAGAVEDNGEEAVSERGAHLLRQFRQSLVHARSLTTLLPVAGGAASTEVSAAEATESTATAAAAGAEAAEATAAPSAAPCTHEVPEQHAGEETGATAAASPPAAPSEEREQEDDADDQQRPGDATSVGLRRRTLRLGALEAEIERDVFRGGHAGGHRLDAGEDRIAVIAGAKLRAHVAQDAADEAVGEDGLEAIADLDAVLVVLRGQEQEQAFVAALVTDAPLAGEGVGEILDGLAVERLDGDHGDLHAGGLFDAAEVGFERVFGAVVEDMGEIADIALGLQGVGVKGEESGGEEKWNNAGYEPAAGWEPAPH